MNGFIRRILTIGVLAAMGIALVACPSGVRSNRANSPAARARQQQAKPSDSQPSKSSSGEESSNPADWLGD